MDVVSAQTNSSVSSSLSEAATAPGPGALNVLLVDDEPDLALMAADALRDAGHRVTTAENGLEALDQVTTQVFDVMICDIRLPRLDGLSLFRRTRQESPDTTVILMTAFAAIQDAVAAVKEGAHDYLTKPFEIDEIILRVQRIAEHRSLLRELEDARAQLAKHGGDETIVGRSVQMLRLMDRVNTIATSHAPVLLQGESGTGKELVARALHDRGARHGKAFIAGQLRRLPGHAARGGAVRSRARRLHGRGAPPRRKVQGRARRNSVAGRGRRDVASRAGQAAARAAGGVDRAARDQRIRPRRRAGHLRHAQEPQGAHHRRRCFARTCTTGSTCSTSTFRRCASERAIFPCSRSTSSRSSPSRAPRRRAFHRPPGGR